jgi:transposase
LIRSEWWKADAGVKLLYLPPYSPDFNPIEEFFAELKAYIKKSWSPLQAPISVPATFHSAGEVAL